MSEFYRVDEDDVTEGCKACGHGKHWTVVSGTGDDEVGIGTAYGDKELADDVCAFMNMAYDAGKEKLADAMAALTELVFMARTASGTAGRDEALCRACDQAEAVIGQKVPPCARRKPADQVPERTQ